MKSYRLGQIASFAWKSLHIQRPIVVFISGFSHTSQEVAES